MTANTSDCSALISSFKYIRQIKCDLIVARTRRVELFAHIADALRKLRLDKHMNVLSLRVELQRPGLQGPRGSRPDPPMIGSASACVRMPHLASMAACAMEPVISCLYIRPSTAIEELNASANAEVSASDRPAQSLFIVYPFLMKAQRLPLPGAVSKLTEGCCKSATSLCLRRPIFPSCRKRWGERGDFTIGCMLRSNFVGTNVSGVVPLDR